LESVKPNQQAAQEQLFLRWPLLLLLLLLFTRMAIKPSVVIVVGYHCYRLHTKFYPIFFSRLSPYIDEIIEDHQRGFRRNRSTTDQIFCIRQILEKKWEYNENETVHQLFIDFKKVYN
jgi:hypothetical protein